MSTRIADAEYRSPKKIGLLIQILIGSGALMNISKSALLYGADACDASNLKNIAALMNIFGNLFEILVIPLVFAELILIVIWLRRTIRNLPALNVQNFWSKDWHAFMFIVPVVNMVWPMVTLHEVWKASNPSTLDGQTWKDSPPSGIVNTWWTLMILGIGLSLPLQGHLVPKDFATHMGIVSTLLNLATQVAFIVVIGSISSKQESKHIHLIAQANKQQ